MDDKFVQMCFLFAKCNRQQMGRWKFSLRTKCIHLCDNYTQDTQSAWFYSLKVSQTLSTDSFGTGFTVSWRGNFCDSAERLFRGVLESKQQNLPLQHLWSPPVTQQSGGSVLDRTVDGRAYGVQALLPIYTSCTWALDTFQEPKGISENVWKKERQFLVVGFV